MSAGIKFEGEHSEVVAKTLNGEIELKGVTGAVEASTLGGRIRVKGDAVERAELRTMSGEIELDSSLASRPGPPPLVRRRRRRCADLDRELQRRGEDRAGRSIRTRETARRGIAAAGGRARPNLHKGGPGAAPACRARGRVDEG